MSTNPIKLDRIVVFDTETSGVNVYEDRIVTAFIGVIDTKTEEVLESWSWLVNPGVEIPQGAVDVHGVTNERARAEGMDAATAVFEITQRLDILNKRALPVVIMNAVYDLTILAAEMHRYWPGAREVVPNLVIDPMVLDKAIDPFRPGKKTLVDLCAVYGVPVSPNAHDAQADCIMAGGVAMKLMVHPRIAAHSTIEAFMDKSRKSKFAQTKGLKEFYEKQSKATWSKKLGREFTDAEREEFRVRGEGIAFGDMAWPIKPLPWVENGGAGASASAT